MLYALKFAFINLTWMSKSLQRRLLIDLPLFHGVSHHTRVVRIVFDHVRSLEEVFSKVSAMTIKSQKPRFSVGLLPINNIMGNHHIEIYTNIRFTHVQNLQSSKRNDSPSHRFNAGLPVFLSYCTYTLLIAHVFLAHTVRTCTQSHCKYMHMQADC